MGSSWTSPIPKSLAYGLRWGSTSCSSGRRTSSRVVCAAQHRVFRPRLHPDHVLRYGLLRKRNVAAPGRGVLRVLRPSRPVRAHGGKGEGPSACQGCGGCEPGRCVNCYECFRRAAPETRKLNLRSPAVGLGRPEKPLPGVAAFVIVVPLG